MTENHDPACAAQDDLRIARRVIEEGDLPHAAFHVAAALNDAPDDAQALALADELLRRSSDPFSLAPLKPDENFAGTVALRARFLQKRSRHGEALELIADLLRVTKKIAFLEWGCASIGAMGSELELPALLRLMGAAWMKFVNGTGDEDRQRLVQLVDVLRANEQRFGESGEFLAQGSMVLRKAGDLVGALAWGERSYAIEPNFMSALAVANSHRERGALDEYLRWIEITHSHESDGCSALLDLGDTLLQQERFEEAASAFARALAKTPDHPWATPSLFYARARLSGAESLSWRARLLDYARDNAENAQAQRLARLARPWTHYLPSPADASIGGLRKMVESRTSFIGISLGLSALEAPSCYLAFRLEAQRQGQTLDLKVSVAEIQKPDPRDGRAEKAFEVWSYRTLFGLKTDAEIRLPPPDPQLRSDISAIAEQPYDLAQWCELGRATALKVGVAKLRDVLATLVHPSLPPASYPSWEWVLRLQFAACCTIAGMDEGWDGTLRRRALLSLLRGPIDWINGAAAMVLSEIHRSSAAARPEIENELLAQLRRVPNAYSCFRSPLAAACLRLPDLPRDMAERLQDWLWS